MQDVAGLAAGIGGGELAVPGRSQEGEGRDQRTGADAGDHREGGASAGVRPTDHDAGAIGAVRAAAGNGQDVELLGAAFLKFSPRLGGEGERGLRIVGVEADVRALAQGGALGLGDGEVLARKRGATRKL